MKKKQEHSCNFLQFFILFSTAIYSNSFPKDIIRKFYVLKENNVHQERREHDNEMLFRAGLRHRARAPCREPGEVAVTQRAQPPPLLPLAGPDKFKTYNRQNQAAPRSED